MTNTLARIWNGDITPVAYLGTNNKEVRDLENLMRRITEKIEEEFNEKAKDLFEKYQDCNNEYLSLLAEQAFCDGFGLAVRVLTESFTHAEEVLKS